MGVVTEGDETWLQICNGTQTSLWDPPVDEQCGGFVVQQADSRTCLIQRDPAGDTEINCLEIGPCMAYNAAALSNACVEIEEGEQAVNYESPTADPTIDPNGGVCVVGFNCLPAVDPGLGSESNSIVIPDHKISGYAEATVLCAEAPTADVCRVAL